MFRASKPSSGKATATVVLKRPSLDFSRTGFIYVGMLMFMGLAAINSQANLLFGIFGLMIGVLLISGVISRQVLRHLSLRRILPEHGCVGHPATITYEIANRKRFWPSLSMVVAELDGIEGFTKQPQCYVLHVAAKMTASVPQVVVPKRRGLHELTRYQIVTSFPFGFVKRAVIGRHKDVLLVYPPVANVHPSLLAMCRAADTTGDLVRPRPGGTDEFYGLKEFRPGDNPRWIYWRRSARSGTLVAKEMSQVAPPRVLLLVDTFLASRSLQDHAAVERCIAMAASLAAHALDQGFAVGLCAWSCQWVTIHPGSGKRFQGELLTVLSRLPLNTSHRLKELLNECQTRLRTGTTPILFTPRDVEVGTIEGGRGGMIVIPAGSPRAQNWFHFGPEADFSNCMPAAARSSESSRTVESRQEMLNPEL